MTTRNRTSSYRYVTDAQTNATLSAQLTEEPIVTPPVEVRTPTVYEEVYVDKSGYNVPGNVSYNPSSPLDTVMMSIQDPLGISPEGTTWVVDTRGQYGIDIDADGHYYVSNANPRYVLKFDSNKDIYIANGGN
jgi:hypothetical protein